MANEQPHDSVKTPPDAMAVDPTRRIMFKPDYKLQEVVGVVHNHPPSIVDAVPESDRKQSADINKLPSDGDWTRAREKFGDRTDVACYVLGPDQVLRKHDYQHNQEWDRKNEHAYWDRNHGRFPGGPALATGPAPDRDAARTGAHVGSPIPGPEPMSPIVRSTFIPIPVATTAAALWSPMRNYRP